MVAVAQCEARGFPGGELVVAISWVNAFCTIIWLILYSLEAELLELVLQHITLFSAFSTLSLSLIKKKKTLSLFPFFSYPFFFENCANRTLHQVLSIPLQKLFANSDRSSNLAGFT